MGNGLLFEATGVVIDLLDRLFQSEIMIHDASAIREGPTLFVVNHFTRLETLLIPYALYKKRGLHVRSLAHASLFSGSLAFYLEHTGCLATDDPNRDEVVLGDLVSGRASWIFYPEGQMMKSKRVTHEGDFIMESEEGSQPVHTGAALLAMHAEQLKATLLNARAQGDRDVLEQLYRTYQLSDETVLSGPALQIVPVSVSYYPVRPGRNPIVKTVEKVVGEMDPRGREELEIEGNLILNADIEIRFGKGIDIAEYLEEAGGAAQADVASLRGALTTRFMKEVYGGVSLNFDHFFALTLYNIPYDVIGVERLKCLIVMNVLDAMALGNFYFHQTLKEGYARVIAYAHYAPFDDVVAMCEVEGLLTRRGDAIALHHKALAHEREFHRIRLDNTIHVIYNEIALFKPLKEIATRNSAYETNDLKAMLYHRMMEDAQRGYEEDYNRADPEKRKPFYIGAPFFYEAKSAKAVLLFSHGFGAAPAEVKELGAYLAARDVCSVYGVRLKGHGTVPEDLKEAPWEAWVKSFEEALGMLRCRYDKVFIGGFSAGGLIALRSGAQSEGLLGVISINAALRLKNMAARFAGAAQWMYDAIEQATSKNLDDTIPNQPEHPEINYNVHYLKSIQALMGLMDATKPTLPHLKGRLLAIQSKEDPTVDPVSLERLKSECQSAEVKAITTPESYHVSILGEGRYGVFREVEEFINEEIKRREAYYRSGVS